MIPKLVDKPHKGVFIGRGSPFGNPFRVTPDRSREEAVEEFRKWYPTSPTNIQNAIEFLKGKDLFCPGCKGTTPCHGEVLLEIANAVYEH